MESAVETSGEPNEPSAETAPSDRLRRLIEVGIALTSELSLETLLRRLIETAVELTGARFGALGVVDESGSGLSQFITVGIDALTGIAVIGAPAHSGTGSSVS